MKRKNLSTLLLFFGVALTLLAINAYQYMPPKVLNVFPSNVWKTELFTAYNSEVVAFGEWEEGSQTRFHCIGQKTDLRYICGINFFLGNKINEGVDLSGYKKILIKAKYTGKIKQVILFFRSFNPSFSVVEDANSAKYMYLNINAEEFNTSDVVEIQFDELTVPDWWRFHFNLKRTDSPPEFTNVPILGLDFSSNVFNEDRVDFEIESIVFEGPIINEEHWYLAILGVWMTVIMAVVAQQFYVLTRRTLSYSSAINKLSKDKAHLEVESKKFQRLSSLDRLTGALNRLGIEEFISNAFSEKECHVIGLMIIDIDHFKHVNDTWGHDVGDVVLKKFVELIQNSIRPTDILGRWGGEEFVLITPNTEETAAFRVAEKIRVLLTEQYYNTSNPFTVTASFGVTSILPNESFDVGLKRADVALYKAKAQGRNRTIIADRD